MRKKKVTASFNLTAISSLILHKLLILVLVSEELVSMSFKLSGAKSRFIREFINSLTHSQIDEQTVFTFYISLSIFDRQAYQQL